MQFGQTSTTVRRAQLASRNCVHLPCPGPISNIVVVGSTCFTRGKIVNFHSASGLPHGPDHSSPSFGHLYLLFQTSTFSLILGILNIPVKRKLYFQKADP